MSDELDVMASSRSSRATPVQEVLDSFRFYVWLVRGTAVAVIGATVWVTSWFNRVEGKFAEYDKLVVLRTGEIATIRADIHELQHYAVTNDAQNAAEANIATKLSERVTKNENRFEALEPHVSEMWFMKEHGIPNREDYQMRHPGEAAPTYAPAPEATPK